MSDEDNFKLCRNYFIVGSIFLPSVLFVNCYWFYSYVFSEDDNQQYRGIKKYVYLSFGLGLFYIFMFCLWFILYSQLRVKFGKFGENISIYIPKGSY